MRLMIVIRTLCLMCSLRYLFALTPLLFDLVTRPRPRSFHCRDIAALSASIAARRTVLAAVVVVVAVFSTDDDVPTRTGWVSLLASRQNMIRAGTFNLPRRRHENSPLDTRRRLAIDRIEQKTQ